MYETVHGRLCVRIGHRLFAVRKTLSNADRVHAATQLPSSWNRQMTIPAPRLIRTRSIKA